MTEDIDRNGNGNDSNNKEKEGEGSSSSSSKKPDRATVFGDIGIGAGVGEDVGASSATVAGYQYKYNPLHDEYFNRLDEIFCTLTQSLDNLNAEEKFANIPSSVRRVMAVVYSTHLSGLIIKEFIDSGLTDNMEETKHRISVSAKAAKDMITSFMEWKDFISQAITMEVMESLKEKGYGVIPMAGGNSSSSRSMWTDPDDGKPSTSVSGAGRRLGGIYG